MGLAASGGRSIADLNEFLGQTADPETLDGWTEARVLSPAFLETVLLHEPYRSALPRRGIYVVGAWFRDAIDLSGASYRGPYRWRERALVPM